MSHYDINRALHAMAAHLHRYTSELKSTDDITALIMEHHALELRHDREFQKVERDLLRIQLQFRAIKGFLVELEQKIQISLALVSSPALTC